MDFWVEAPKGSRAGGGVPHLWLCIAALAEAQRLGADAFLVKEPGQRAVRYQVSEVVAALVKDPSLNAYRKLQTKIVGERPPTGRGRMQVRRMKETRGGLYIPA